jgi:prepilin-type N-terminal cleavage/methylation domain-containing protein
MNLTRKHLGFTIIELTLSLAILSILAALAVPMFGDDNKLQTEVTRRLLTSDLEYAQILAISYPEEEIALVVTAENNGWYIANTDSPDVPLIDDVTQEPLSLLLGEGSAACAETVTLSTNTDNQMVVFDQNGGLKDFTQPVDITINCKETSVVIQINPMTGTIN